MGRCNITFACVLLFGSDHENYDDLESSPTSRHLNISRTPKVINPSPDACKLYMPDLLIFGFLVFAVNLHEVNFCRTLAPWFWMLLNTVYVEFWIFAPLE